MTRRRWRTAAWLLCWASLFAMVGIVTAPWFEDTSTYGFHDWDVVTSFRYLVKISLLEHGEFPGWNPYACGGYPLWGYVEGGTNLISPWLPAYLALPLSLAIRIETVGMALLGAVGAYLLAGRFTKSYGARLLVAALWAVNGRWGLQIASGHTWHLAYAWLPWCFFFYERARHRRHGLRDLTLGGGCFAMLVYSGGIYPLPHTVLLLGCYAAICAVEERSARPLYTLAVSGLIGIGLAAPKLLPILDTFAADPRLIESTERLDLGAFVTLLTERQQGFYSRPARVHPYGWHEWGMYISGVGLGILVLGLLLVDGRRERALKIVGFLALLLGFGAFHPAAPWPLLHAHVPVFQSQHVPSRFLYPAVLILALVAASGLGKLVRRWRYRAAWLDLVVVLGAAALAVDVALVAQLPMKSAMWMVPPEIPTGRPFHFEQNPPFHYQKRDWAGPMLLSMMANTGVLNCYGVPRLEPHRPAPLSHRDRGYRGEATLQSGGRAQILEWSPNSVTIGLQGVRDEDLLTYNMSYRRGWSASVGTVSPTRRGAISVKLPEGTSFVRLSYRPPGLWRGLGLAALTILVLGALSRRGRRWLRHLPLPR